MKFLRLHHVALNIRDIDDARKFYVGCLGLPEVARPDFGFPGLWLGLGEQTLHLIPSDEVAAHGQHFALQVEDLEAALEDLASRGIHPEGRLDVPNAGRQAFVRDPFGNLIELNEPN